MNLLDEQVREDQRRLLTQWGIPFRQIGREIARRGIDDEDIIPWLHSLKRPTLFTHDQWFFNSRLCRAGYCLVYLDVDDAEAADYIRRFMKHPRFKTQASRMGIVARAHREAVHFWERTRNLLQKVPWDVG